MKRCLIVLSSVAMLVMGSVSRASATPFIGSLTGAGLGINQDGFSNMTFSWVVTQNSATDWTYRFTLTNNSTARNPATIDRLLIEVSDNFSFASDVSNFSGAAATITGPSSFSSGLGGGYASIPSAFNALQFAFTTAATTDTIAFHSDKAPVWGDFYAVGGNGNGARVDDAGFGNPDVDPGNPSADGSVNNNILRPDGASNTPVPEPTSLLLLCTGIAGLARRRLATGRFGG